MKLAASILYTFIYDYIFTLTQPYLSMFTDCLYHFYSIKNTVYTLHYAKFIAFDIID